MLPSVAMHKYLSCWFFFFFLILFGVFWFSFLPSKMMSGKTVTQGLKDGLTLKAFCYLVSVWTQATPWNLR